MKFDMQSIADAVRKVFKDRPEIAATIGVGSNLDSLEATDYLTMPKWWEECTGVPGLPYGRIVQIAGDSDTGKTSAAIQAMKAAQDQGVAVIYVETEGKTTRDDMVNWGVDPDQIFLIQTNVAEKAFDALRITWDSFKDKYPTARLLLVFDSFGNTVTLRDSDLELTEKDSQPGGKGKTNRVGLGQILTRASQTAVLIINYTYANIGSHGSTNAGGKALHFHSSLIFQTSRKGWIEKTEKGIKKRIGAEVLWRLNKNHLSKSVANKKEFTLRITADGIECVDD